MMTAGEIISVQGQKVWWVPSRDTVFNALKMMSDKNIGALLVRDGSKKVVGIVSERDYARKVVLLGKTSQETPVEAIMTPAAQMVTIQPETSLETCMALMTAHHIRHLPVFAKDDLVGIVSSRDVVQALIEEKRRVAKNLEEVSDTLFTLGFDDHIAGGKG